MDAWGWVELESWLDIRLELSAGPLLCVITARPADATGRPPRHAPSCGAPPPRRECGARFVPHQLGHAYAVVTVSGSGQTAQILGLAARTTVSAAIAGSDRITVNALAGDDVIIGGAATDTIDGAPGDDVVIQSLAAGGARSASVRGAKWLKAHSRVVKGKTVLVANGQRHKLPRAKRARLLKAATS